MASVLDPAHQPVQEGRVRKRRRRERLREDTEQRPTVGENTAVGDEATGEEDSKVDRVYCGLTAVDIAALAREVSPAMLSKIVATMLEGETSKKEGEKSKQEVEFIKKEVEFIKKEVEFIKKEVVHSKKEYKAKLQALRQQLLAKEREYVISKGLLRARGIFEHALRMAFNEMVACKWVRGKFNATDTIQQLGEWADSLSETHMPNVVVQAARACDNDSDPGQILSQLWIELCGGVHGDPWFGPAVKFHPALTGVHKCIVTKICEAMQVSLEEG